VLDYEAKYLDWLARRRRRRILIVGIVVISVLLANLAYIASIAEPKFDIESITVSSISIPTHTLYLSVDISVDNNNAISAHLLSVDGDIISAEKPIGTFSSKEDVSVPAYSNVSVHIDVQVTNVPMPLPDPVLVVKGKARLRAWIVGVTYHFEHTIPLTYSTDLVNKAPVAVISSQTVARRDTQVPFDGSASFDPDGRVVGWNWDFGDGYTAEGPIVQHPFLTRGTFDVVLTVSDQMGATSTATWTIRILIV
jgi:PKD repeat protein